MPTPSPSSNQSPQLSKPSSAYEISPYLLNICLLPLLSHSFTQLTSLNLSFAAIQLLIALTSLQQLRKVPAPNTAGATTGARTMTHYASTSAPSLTRSSSS